MIRACATDFLKKGDPQIARSLLTKQPSIRARRVARFASFLALVCLGGAAYADSSLPVASGSDAAGSGEVRETLIPTWPFGFLSGSWESPNLLGDMGGLRPALDKYGMSLSVIENAETLGNLTGGVRQGFEVNGLTTATLELDAQRAFGLSGGLFHVSGLHIWGGLLSLTNLDNLQAVSGLEAYPSVRLWEAWYQQKFGDRFDIKIGEQSLDQEFMVSQNASFFINSTLGWPILPTLDMPGGGPAYPLAGLGFRARAEPTDSVTVLAGLFNGSPIPKDSPDTQLSNPYGVSFPLDTGVLAIAEVQIKVPGSADLAKASDEGPLPGLYKFGAWYDSYTFDDLRYDSAGVPLASAESNGISGSHQGNYSIYAVADQMVWRSSDPNRNINVCLRPMITPLQDRNLITFSLNAGVTMHEPFLGRDNDIVGVGMGLARVSNGVSGHIKDLNFYDPTIQRPTPGAETFVEASYQYQAAKWWQIQPDVQYIFNPGAGLTNRQEPTQKIKNELVIGLRTNITF